jgi:hypothetical protein
VNIIPICRMCGQPFTRGLTIDRQHSCEECLHNTLSGSDSQQNIKPSPISSVSSSEQPNKPDPESIPPARPTPPSNAEYCPAVERASFYATVVCAWCHRVIGQSPGHAKPNMISHGICPGCFGVKKDELTALKGLPKC